MHQKDFQLWSQEKEKLHNKKNGIAYPKEREIWYVKIGINIGFETDGKDFFLRPMLIVKRFGNLLFCVAMTSKYKNNDEFEIIKRKLKSVLL